jgi:hypothetical protein
MADIKITVDSSQIRQAKADTQALESATTRFDKKLDPLLKKEKAFATAVKQVNDAMRLGVATQKQAIAEIERLGKAYGQTQAQIDRTTASMTGVRKNTNRMNATIQNAGYQFGDFFVQVQSGQNALVAFSQQGAQLAGLLPGVAGAVTGVAVVVGSMLARSLMEGSGLFKSFREEIEETGEALDSLRDRQEKLAYALQNDLGPEIVRFSEVALKRAIAEGTKEANDALQSLTKTVEDQAAKLERRKNLAYTLFGFQGDSSSSNELLSGLERATELMQRISGIDPTNVEDLRAAIDAITQILEGEFGPQLKLSESALNDLTGLNDKLTAQYTALVESAREQNEELEEQEDSISNIVVHSKELVQLFGQLQSLSAGIDEAFKRTAIQASLIGQGVGKALAGQMASMRMKISEERAKLVELVGPRFADELLKGRSGQLADYEAMLAQINAPTPSRGGGGGGGVKPEDQGEKLAQAYAKFQDKLNGVLLSRRQEILLNREIVDLSKEEQDLVKALGVTREQLTDVQKRSYDEILELRRQDIALMKKQQTEEERLAKAKEKVQAVASTLANETVGALKSIVNGTKTASQAFRDMALNIIQQIMDILIWQPLIQSLTNSISGAISGSAGGGGTVGGIVSSIFGFQKGGAFNAGNVVPFANGGIVGSPTYFGMSGGRTGLMGEAGPEAIMPLKRGPDGKLGVEGSGSVTVNQTFQFAANGDESVKRIIAEAAPKIAKMTEVQIINSRQRGGQMRRAFG